MRIVPFAASLLLAACQAPNPYQAQSQPLPPAPPVAAMPADPGSYPAAARDFSRYRSWRWQQLPAGSALASGEQIAEMVAAGLDQRGLRPALGDSADLLVRAQAESRLRIRQVYDDYGSYYGQARHGHGYGLYGQQPVLREYAEPVAEVSIELLDPRDGQTLWRGTGQSLVEGSARRYPQALRQAVRQALADYPPR